MNLFIASDHAGFPLKKALLENVTALASLGITFTDLGTHSTESVDYPNYGFKMAEAIGNSNQLGVLICGSGVGISIAANRFHHIRAVLAESTEVAKLGREHNHANVLCLGARIISPEKAIQILSAFLNAKVDSGERHLKRIQKLTEKGC